LVTTGPASAQPGCRGVLRNAMQIRAQEMIQSNQTRKEADHAE
jgi:hypothetical protein